ncbi:MAG TPA: hypothetical protein VGO11_25590 [Chthoniobacteraceae bacterium]|nr:hypothetical protein [Chthoniobacteraceae bacterium]
MRIPDDGREYPLPPGFGRFPLYRSRQFAAQLPPAWSASGSLFIPMYQKEALWLAFEGRDWHPCAVRVGVGGVDALTGEPWDSPLSSHPQNYLVVPDQLWLDGIKASEGGVRQFVALPLGLGHTIEGQLTGEEKRGGLQLRLYEARPGRFPERAPRRPSSNLAADFIPHAGARSALGFGAGGRMRQKVYPDAYGFESWESEPAGEVEIHLVNSREFQRITGQCPPSSPIDAAAYSARGLPWFELDDELQGDLAPASALSGVKSTAELDLAHAETPVEVKREQISKVSRRRRADS